MSLINHGKALLLVLISVRIRNSTSVVMVTKEKLGENRAQIHIN